MSDEEGDEDAAQQGHGGRREDHHHDAARHVDQRAEPRPHQDLGQLHHAGQRRAVHARAPLRLGGPSQLQLLLIGGECGVGEGGGSGGVEERRGEEGEGEERSQKQR